MSSSIHLKLAVFTILVTTCLSQSMEPLPIIHFNKWTQHPLSQSGAKWTPISLPGKPLKRSSILHFDSINADVSMIIYDSITPNISDCYIYAIVNQTVYGTIGAGFSKQYCSMASITKIDRSGHVLFTTGSGQYYYITDQGKMSESGQIQGNLLEALAQGVEFGLTKSNDGEKNDYFRIFSRASTMDGQYPENFYYLVSNTTFNGFSRGSYNTLTLKKTSWVFKNTSTDVNFSSIEQVNFVSTQGGEYVLEGQWITGKSTNQNASPVCQYGAANLRYFADGPSPQDNIMYGYGGLHFPCTITPSLSTYQGVIVYSGDLNYFYAINSQLEKI